MRISSLGVESETARLHSLQMTSLPRFSLVHAVDHSGSTLRWYKFPTIRSQRGMKSAKGDIVSATVQT